MAAAILWIGGEISILKCITTNIFHFNLFWKRWEMKFFYGSNNNVLIITFESTLNHLIITFKSTLNHLIITYKSTLNYLLWRSCYFETFSITYEEKSSQIENSLKSFELYSFDFFYQRLKFQFKETFQTWLIFENYLYDPMVRNTNLNNHL